MSLINVPPGYLDCSIYYGFFCFDKLDNESEIKNSGTCKILFLLLFYLAQWCLSYVYSMFWS